MIETLLAVLFFFLALVNFAMLTAFLMPGKKFSKFTPPLSVVIPAHDEEKYIEKTIKAVAAASYPNKKEIIVVDDGSTDGTAAVVKKCGVRLISIKHSGKAKAINHGLRKARYDYVVYVDADSYLEKDALIELVRPLREKNVAIASGVIRAKHTKNPWSWLQDIEYIGTSGWRRACDNVGATYIAPGFAAMKKKAVLGIGGFSSDTLTEDVDTVLMLRKAGYGAAMTNAMMFTSVPETLRRFVRQRIRWGRGAIQTARKHSDVFLSKPKTVGFFSFPMHIFWFPFALIYLPVSFYWMFSAYFSSGFAPLSFDTLMFFVRWVTLYGIFDLFKNVITGAYAMTPVILSILLSWIFSFAFLVVSMKRFSAWSWKFSAYIVMFPFYWITMFANACVFVYELVFHRRGNNVWDKSTGNSV